jgi:hypothetical protein
MHWLNVVLVGHLSVIVQVVWLVVAQLFGASVRIYEEGKDGRVQLLKDLL